MNLARRVSIAFLTSGLSLAPSLASFAQQPPPPATQEVKPVPGAKKAPEAVGKERGTNPEDVQFITQAETVNLVEIEASKLALSRGSKKEVRAFATMMLKDHGGASEELKALAASKGVALPETLPNDKRSDIERLGTDKEFDLHYAAMMVEGHEAAIALFERASTDSKDDDVQTWAQKILPKLQGHLRQAREIKAKAAAPSR